MRSRPVFSDLWTVRHQLLTSDQCAHRTGNDADYFRKARFPLLILRCRAQTETAGNRPLPLRGGSQPPFGCRR